LGSIVNDTSKFYLFPEKETLFPYLVKEKISESYDLKKLMKLCNSVLTMPNYYLNLKSLSKLKDFLIKNTSLNAHFTGHTSDESSDEYNQK